MRKVIAVLCVIILVLGLLSACDSADHCPPETLPQVGAITTMGGTK